MYLTGFADEAGQTIEEQIKVHLDLGWNHIEIRTVEGVNFTELEESKFEHCCQVLEAADMQVSEFGSGIANWAKEISGDFNVDLEDLKRAIPRMQKLKCQFIRIMSYPNDKNNPWEKSKWFDETVKRIKELSKMAEDGGIILAHENCSGYGESVDECLELMQAVESPAFRMAYDTGNPVMYGDSAWEFYEKIKDYIAYVHIKDGIKEGETTNYTMPGEGNGSVRKTVEDLLKNGYDGGFSMEPHIAGQIHKGTDAAKDVKARDVYIQYGRTFEKLLAECKASV